MTVRKLATLTNLSPSTIYRALKNPEKAKPEVLAIIHSVTQDTTLNAKGIKIVYIVFPHANQFYMQIIVEITSLLLRHNIKVIPFITNEDEEKEHLFFKSLSLSSKVCILWSPTTQKIPYFAKKKKDRPFIILFNRKFDTPCGDIELSLDNYYASQKATEKLIEHNNKNILYIGGTSSLSTTKDRENGFLDTIQRHAHIKGTSLQSSFHEWSVSYNIISSVDISQYDSILCGNETISYGVLKYLNEKNYQIPKDIRLISFDYTPIFEALQISMIYFSPKYIANKMSDLICDIPQNSIPSYLFLPEYIEKGSEYYRNF